MPKATDAAPADEVPQWPLVFGLCLLALGAFWNWRLGNDRVALILTAAAVAIPLFGVGLRSYLGKSRAPRIRRVVVVDEPAPRATIPLETAKYITPEPLPGLPDRAPDEAAAQV